MSEVAYTATPEMIDDCIKAGIRDGKVLPRYRTTNSHYGVTRYGKLLPILKHCGTVGMRVHFHFEHPSAVYSAREAEYGMLSIAQIFLEETEVTIIWEHGSDSRCIPHWVEFSKSKRFYLTLTAHHLIANEDQVRGDIRGTCAPSIKTEIDRQALLHLVAQDFVWVMAGGDDAAHDLSRKHVHEGRCANGSYTGAFLLPLYAHALDDLINSPDRVNVFRNFTFRNALDLYELTPHAPNCLLVREKWKIPPSYIVGQWVVQPFMAGQPIKWRIKD